jgi:tRNA G37 N-methylase Trm5
MRHLSVPRLETERWRIALQEANLLARNASISGSGEHRLIPLDESAPPILPPPFAQFSIIESTPEIHESTKDWRAKLENLVGTSIYEGHRHAWPSAHEQIGDIIILKSLDLGIESYAKEIAIAMLQSMSRMRVACLDTGVKGKFRVRNLTPLAIQKNGEIQTISKPYKTPLTTTEIREYGAAIMVDPSRAYFSTKLSGEREQNVVAASKLSRLLQRRLAVCDPYCGVGPALVHLLRADLIDKLLASDLNPAAMPLLAKNLEVNGVEIAKSKDISTTSNIWSEMMDNVIDPPTISNQSSSSEISLYAGVVDARRLQDDIELSQKWEMLLVNLPHDAIEHLPDLLPLLRTDCTTLIRGWTILSNDEISVENERLIKLLPKLDTDLSPVNLIEPRKSYSASQSLCRFEAWLEPVFPSAE